MKYEEVNGIWRNLKDMIRALKMLVTNFLSRGKTECATGSRC